MCISTFCSGAVIHCFFFVFRRLTTASTSETEDELTFNSWELLPTRLIYSIFLRLIARGLEPIFFILFLILFSLKKKVLVRHVLLVEQDRSRLKVEQSSRRTDGMLTRQCCAKHRRMLHWNSPCNIELKHWRRLMLYRSAMKRSQIRTFLFFAKKKLQPTIRRQGNVKCSRTFDSLECLSLTPSFTFISFFAPFHLHHVQLMHQIIWHSSVILLTIWNFIHDYDDDRRRRSSENVEKMEKSVSQEGERKNLSKL